MAALSGGYLAVIAILIVIFIVVAAFVGTVSPSVRWIIISALMICFFIVIGLAINQKWDGILIDERNRKSLSRFQIIIWTLIIVSAFFAIASARIIGGEPDPLAITIDWQLWAVLGISSTSLAGTPLIRNYKENRTTDPSELKRLTTVTESKQRGILYIGTNKDEADFTDIFKGDEVGNYDHVDVSKVQMFFFTIISALSYAVMLFAMLSAPGTPSDFPKLPDGLIALLTISHGAYLANKSVDHTPKTFPPSS
jgi:hypothetical protein